MLANTSTWGATVLLRGAIKLNGLMMTLRPPVVDAGMALEDLPTEVDAEAPQPYGDATKLCCSAVAVSKA